MGEEKSSAFPQPIGVLLRVKLELAPGQVVELPGAKLGYELGPFLYSNLADAQGSSNGYLGFEVLNDVGFAHQHTISMLYQEYNTALPASGYPDAMETMGDRIRMLRHSKGWTQQQLGDRLGVSKVAVYQWEVGTTSDIKLKTFLRLVEELGTNPQYLLFGHESQRPQARKRSQP